MIDIYLDVTHTVLARQGCLEALPSRRYGRCANPTSRAMETLMSTNNTYLAVFLGSKSSARRLAWDAMPDADRRPKEREGMEAWKAWMGKHQAAIVAMGG